MAKSTVFGLLKLKEKRKVYTYTAQKGNGAVVSITKNDINPMFFMERDDMAERVCVKVSTSGSYNVDWVILIKRKRKENIKNLYFGTKAELTMWLIDYFKVLDKIFVEDGPDHNDKKLFIDFLLGMDLNIRTISL